MQKTSFGIGPREASPLATDWNNGVPMGIMMKVTALCALAFLTGCASVSGNQGNQTQRPLEFDDVERVLTDIGPDYVRRGTAIEPRLMVQAVSCGSTHDV